jgi:hypothetical protein
VRAEPEKGGDTFGAVEAEPETSEDAEVVGDQLDPPKPERVEQREHVGENIAHGVPSCGASVQPAPRRSGATTR